MQPESKQDRSDGERASPPAGGAYRYPPMPVGWAPRPRRMGFLIFVAAFAILNLWIARFCILPDTASMIERSYVGIGPLLGRIHKDPAPIKVYLLGNSVSRFYETYLPDEYKAWAETIKRSTHRPVAVYNVGLEFADISTFRLVLSKLQPDRNSVVVIPVMGISVDPWWCRWMTALDGLLADPVVIAGLGWRSYRDQLRYFKSKGDDELVLRGALKRCFPLYGGKSLILTKLNRWNEASALRPVHWIAQGVLPKMEQSWTYTLAWYEKDKTELNLRVLREMLADLRQRQIPHFVYLAPTQVRDRRQLFPQLYERLVQELKRSGSPWADWRSMQPDNEFFDFLHPMAGHDQQFLSMARQWRRISAVHVREAPAPPADPNGPDFLKQAGAAKAFFVTTAPVASDETVLHVEANGHWLHPLGTPIRPKDNARYGFWKPVAGGLTIILPVSAVHPTPQTVRASVWNNSVGSGPVTRMLRAMESGQKGDAVLRAGMEKP